MKIGIISGSIRQGNRTEGVARWVKRLADAHGGADFELVELADLDIPLLTSSVVPGAAGRQYESAAVRRWSRLVDDCDGFIFVTPEYNHGVPGAFKNAFDSLGPEWTGKPVAFVSHGADGGVRAVEQWRQIVANMQMPGVRQALALSMFTEFADGDVAPNERRADELNTLLEQLLDLTRKLRAA